MNTINFEFDDMRPLREHEKETAKRVAELFNGLKISEVKRVIAKIISTLDDVPFSLQHDPVLRKND